MREQRRVAARREARRYFALHATLDIKHSSAWNREVLRSLVVENPATARAMAEGALMRLEAGRRCFKRYRAELWGSHGTGGKRRSVRGRFQGLTTGAPRGGASSEFFSSPPSSSMRIST